VYNLKNCTFLIPIRVDQKERLRNFNILIRYLKKYLDTNILIGEAGLKEYNNGEIRNNLAEGCRYTFITETSEYFNRMKVINTLAAIVRTPIITIQDTDVLLYPEQYVEALDKILNSGYDLVYPYDGNFYSVPERFIDNISKNLDISFIDVKQCKNMRPEGDSVGGILFWNLKKFKEFGGCNERIISWGYDDTELYERACKLGARIYRCKKGLIHLNHNPSLNSLNGNHGHYKNNEQEWLKVKNMDKFQLKEYVSQLT
jgi:predicted glycosyltransferase involved in capsule biosynthesis